MKTSDFFQTHMQSITRKLIVEVFIITCLVGCSRNASRPVSNPTPGEANSPTPLLTTPTNTVFAPDPTQHNQDGDLDKAENELPQVSSEDTSSAVEYPVSVIELSGPITKPNAEISGMAWYEDYLILLPQYPSKFGSFEDGAIYALSKEDIKSYIEGDTSDPLQPQEIPFKTHNIENRIVGYEGFEAIAFQGNRAYLTIEASPNGMMGYVVSGKINSDLSEFHLDPSKIIDIPPQSEISNMSDESLLVFGDRMITFYEANGANINQSPQVHTFDSALQSRGTLAFPNIEYRITDVTSPDESGRFWAINYFYPGDQKLQPAEDSLAIQFGQGPTHNQNTTVERLVEFQFSYEGILLADTSPIQLQLVNDQNARNWEAIARLEDLGFLLATDKYPETIFAFVSNTRP